MHNSLEELILTCVLFLSFCILQYHLFPSALKPTVNADLLRKSVKAKWLEYYKNNRQWIDNLKIWTTYKGQRRPLSSFILGAISTLDPQLTQMLPLLVDLNNDPDEIVESLGLNFNPEQELEAIAQSAAPEAIAQQPILEEGVKILPPSKTARLIKQPASRIAAQADASCEGVYKKKKLPFDT